MTSHQPNSNLGSGGPGSRSKGPGDTRPRGLQEKHPAGAVGGCVEEHVRRAAQRRRLPVVGHHVREGAARAEASDSAALPGSASHCRTTSRAQSCPPAQRPGRRAAGGAASTVERHWQGWPSHRVARVAIRSKRRVAPSRDSLEIKQSCSILQAAVTVV